MNVALFSFSHAAFRCDRTKMTAPRRPRLTAIKPPITHHRKQGFRVHQCALRLRASSGARGPTASARCVGAFGFSDAVSMKSNRRNMFSPRQTTSGVSVFATRRVMSTQATSNRPDVLDVLKQRGLLAECTNETALRAAASQNSLSVYCGFDPTADSLHLGNLLGIVVLAWFQRCGHVPVALLGGATGRVGDPSGKSTERPVLDDATIERNTAGISKILTNVLANSAAMAQVDGIEPAGPPARVLNNLDWFGGMGFLEFLREVGKYARVGTMMAKDSVKTRLESESGMSFTEFTYQLLQGYDFVHLFKNESVSVQIGGSDQWGNITAGTDLIRRILDKNETTDAGAFGLTFPLLLKENGQKFGKSEDGAVWLSGDRLSPYKFYQYLVQSTDADVIRFMKMLTFVDLDAIHEMEKSMTTQSYKPNTVQKRLAEEVTLFVHGEAGLQKARKATEGLRPGSDTVLDFETLDALSEVVPLAELQKNDVVGKPVADVMALAGLQKSKGEAKRMIKGGGGAGEQRQAYGGGRGYHGG